MIASEVNDGMMALSNVPQAERGTLASGVMLERYRFVLQQIHAINENVYRFLLLYQTVTSGAVGLGWFLFANHSQWGLTVASSRIVVLGLMGLITLVASFTEVFIIIGVLSWLDYRREESHIADVAVGVGFRPRPRWTNVYRWYETYTILFIAASVAAMWWFVLSVLLPMIG